MIIECLLDITIERNCYTSNVVRACSNKLPYLCHLLLFKSSLVNKVLVCQVLIVADYYLFVKTILTFNLKSYFDILRSFDVSDD